MVPGLPLPQCPADADSPERLAPPPRRAAADPAALAIHWHQDIMHLIRNLPSNLTDEQSVLSLFCCHSIVTLDQLLDDHPSGKQIQLQFRDLISSLWTQWLNSSIDKDFVLVAMFRWVRNASSLTRDLDIIDEFVTWFESRYQPVNHLAQSNQQLANTLFDNTQNPVE